MSKLPQHCRCGQILHSGLLWLAVTMNFDVVCVGSIVVGVGSSWLYNDPVVGTAQHPLEYLDFRPFSWSSTARSLWHRR